MMLRLSRYDSLQKEVGSFERYQITLLLVTQMANSAITGSMLCTIYDTAKPKLDSCFDQYDDNATAVSDLCKCRNASLSTDFHSLLYDLSLHCSNNYIPTLMTSSVMVGGVVGAALFGYFADRHGRKMLCVTALAGCSACNLLLYAASHHWISVLVDFVALGVFGGGYMVVNSVLLMESVGGSRWRLLCACLNGWPFGMISMSLIGFLTRHWLWYHISLAALGLLFAVVLCVFVHESPRWLLTREKYSEAENILTKIARTNGRTLLNLKSDDDNSCVALNPQATAALGDRCEVNEDNVFGDKKAKTTSDVSELQTYSYLDLARHSFILKRLIALTYCWLASSVVSFGLYFNLGALAGDRYLNTFLTGIFKFATGLLPYVLDRCCGRKPVLVTSVVVTCLSCWAAVFYYLILADESSNATFWLPTVFAIVGSSAIDPMWKINHLYSTELFPTVVRNMARAVCNVGSRVGSLIGPQVAYLSQLYAPSSFIVYGSIGFVQIFVAAFGLPETKGKPLVDRMPRSKQEMVEVKASSRIQQQLDVLRSDC